MPVFRHGSRGDTDVASDRIATVPNAISLLRMLALPFVYVDIVGGRELRGLAILVVISWTDYLDGYIARRFDQISRLGQMLDPIMDRLFIAVSVVAMVVAGIMPLWLVVALLGRDAIVLVGGIGLALTGRPPPAVTDLGKAATFGVMSTLPLFLLAAGLDSDHLRAAAWVMIIAYGLLYWLTVGQYAVETRRGAPEG